MPIEESEVNRLVKLSEWDDRRFCMVEFFPELSEAEQTFHLVWRLEAEVNNGGFQQFFYNSVGELAPHAAAACRRIGAKAVAGLVDQALAALGDDIPWADSDARQTLMDDLSEDILEKLDALDNAFYQYPDELDALLYHYVFANRDNIRVPAAFWTD